MLKYSDHLKEGLCAEIRNIKCVNREDYWNGKWHVLRVCNSWGINRLEELLLKQKALPHRCTPPNKRPAPQKASTWCINVAELQDDKHLNAALSSLSRCVAADSRRRLSKSTPQSRLKRRSLPECWLHNVRQPGLCMRPCFTPLHLLKQHASVFSCHNELSCLMQRVGMLCLPALPVYVCVSLAVLCLCYATVETLPLSIRTSHTERDVAMKRQLVEDLRTRLKFLQETEKSYRAQVEELEKKVGKHLHGISALSGWKKTLTDHSVKAVYGKFS